MRDASTAAVMEDQQREFSGANGAKSPKILTTGDRY